MSKTNRAHLAAGCAVIAFTLAVYGCGSVKAFDATNCTTSPCPAQAATQDTRDTLWVWALGAWHKSAPDLSLEECEARGNANAAEPDYWACKRGDGAPNWTPTDIAPFTKEPLPAGTTITPEGSAE